MVDDLDDDGHERRRRGGVFANRLQAVFLSLKKKSGYFSVKKQINKIVLRLESAK